MDDHGARVAAERDLLQRRMLALHDPEFRGLSDWETAFVGDVCWRKPEALSARQRETVELLCWRHRDRLPPGLAPAREPKLSERRDRSFDPGPSHRRRGDAALSARGDAALSARGDAALSARGDAALSARGNRR